MRIRHQQIKLSQGAKLEIDLNKKPCYKLECLAEVAAEFFERDYGSKESTSCMKTEVDEYKVSSTTYSNKNSFKKQKFVFEHGECSTGTLATMSLEPKLPQEFEEKIKAMNGRDPILVIEKKLFGCDVKPIENRLSMPELQATPLKDFLTPEEDMRLMLRDERKKLVGIEVVVIDPELRTWNKVPFKRWKLGNSPSFVLIGDWIDIVGKNGLKEGDKVQVWCFRFGDSDELGFALIKYKDFNYPWGAKRRRGSMFVRK